MGIAKEGIGRIIAALIVSSLLALFSFKCLATIAFLAAAFLMNFYRDPGREPAAASGLVSPADGKIIEIEDVFDGDYFGGVCRKLTVFMRVYDVHVNRMPLTGKITRIVDRGDRYYPADQRRAGELNKSRTYYVELAGGKKLLIRQIAGLLARQIVSYRGVNDTVNRGDRIGMIQFGSRVEIYCDHSFAPAVRLGQNVQAGKTILASDPGSAGRQGT